MSPEPVVIIPAHEYESTKAENRFHATWPTLTREGAAAFSAAFDTRRSREWGHVSFCLGVAIDAMKDAAR